MDLKLVAWQRIDALKTFLFPAFHYAMRTAQFNKGDWRKLDLALRPEIKQALKLPPRVSIEYLYDDSNDGLFGIPETATDSDIAKIDSAFKLLTSPDEIVLQTVCKIFPRLLKFVSKPFLMTPISVNIFLVMMTMGGAPTFQAFGPKPELLP